MSSSQKNPKDLRSQRWYAPDDLRSFGHRSRTKQMGYHREEFMKIKDLHEDYLLYFPLIHL